MSGRLPLLGIIAALLSLAAGCSYVQRGQLTSCEVKSRSLSEQNQAQLAEIANLKEHSRRIENQLSVAEEELARLDEKHPVAPPSGAGSRVVTVDRRLIDLCRRYPALRPDPTSGACKFELDTLFESGQSDLDADAKRQLDEFARLFKGSETQDLRVMVVGHTDDQPLTTRAEEKYGDNWHLSAARALAVADYLRRSGLRDEQLGIAGYSRHQPAATTDTETARQTNRRTEIFVLSPETPMVGWRDSSKSRQR